MTRAAAFRHCGGCGAARPRSDGGKRYECDACGWVFYRNPAAAVFVILGYRGSILFVRRAREPAKDTLDLPGGFIDSGEDAETALRRELREELDLEVGAFEFVGTFPNVYPYRGIVYDTVDICFAAELAALPTWSDADEIRGFELVAPEHVHPDAIGLPSVRAAIDCFLSRR